MSSTQRWSAAAALILSIAVLTQLAPPAQAQGVGGARCEIMDWKGLAPKKSMAEFQLMISTHTSGKDVQIMPLTSQGTTTGFMICSWE